MGRRLLYIHVYMGSAEGYSCNMIRSHLPREGFSITGLDYRGYDPDSVIPEIKAYLRDNPTDLVIGMSPGGFYTLMLEGVRRLVINPCYLPSVEIPRLDSWAGDFFRERFVRYEGMIPKGDPLVEGFFGSEDELLGNRYVGRFEKDFKTAHILPCAHHLNDGAAHLLCEYITSMTF